MSEVIADAELYEDDFYAWTQLQADKLRRLQKAGMNLDLDLPRLAEEVEDLGKSERNASRSQIERIIEHCLKLQYSPALEPRRGWYDTITDARRELRYKLTPTLRRLLRRELGRLYDGGRREADRALRRFGEVVPADQLPGICPYKFENLLDEDWLPSPLGDNRCPHPGEVR